MNKILAVIPARGGSKGLPGKNTRVFNGKPLIAWTIEVAKSVPSIERVILSSDDSKIIEVAKTYGCEVPFVRPGELAQDTSPGIDPILHALKELPGHEWIVLLQPTSPLRTARDLQGALDLLKKTGADFCVSVCKTTHPPQWTFTLNAQYEMKALLPVSDAVRRQDLPETVQLNGAIYIARCSSLLKEKTFITPRTIAYGMPAERSIDIDTEMDFKIAEMLQRSPS